MLKLLRLLTFMLVSAATSQALALDTTCLLRYPIVLSHHWGAKKICADATLADASPACRARPEDLEASIPPLTRNAYDASLTRPTAELLHRYYSKAIIDRLQTECGNQVFLSDKPPLASYEERARSLRLTVLHALAQTGAEQVIVIGMSQGVQDARFLVSELPVDDSDPAKGMMRSKVAAVVSVVGEDGGAESASLLLDALYLANGGNWSSTASADALIGLDTLDDLLWQNEQGQYVLSEACEGSCVITSDQDRWRTALHSVVNLCTKYMKPNLLQTYTFTQSWDALRAFLGMPERSWAERVSPHEESDNGVPYLSYAAAIRQPYPAWDAQTLVTWPIIQALSGDNDGHVSVTRQTFENPAANFTHVRTLRGHWTSRGYHHMWFSGRDDALYGPGPGYRESAPYDGSSADFYAQVARDLRGLGL